jgi:hypothetical protein
MLEIGVRQVLHLFPADAQAESVPPDLRHGGPRDEHRPAAQQVSLAQQHRGHPAAACLNREPQHVPDVAVRRVHLLTAGHLLLTGQLVGDGIDRHGPRDRPWHAWRARRSRRHGALGVVIGPRGRRLPAVADVVVALIFARQECLLGGIQPLELGYGAAQPDLVFARAASPSPGSPGVDQAERDDHG